MIKNIYKIVNNIQINDNIIVVNKQFTQNLHLWYNDNAVIHEIYKSLLQFDICVLHEIVIWNNIGKTGQTMYVVPVNYGLQPKTSYLNEELYYNTQILNCKNDIFAIPIVIYNNNDTAHENILIIYKNIDKKIIVEWFEPFGYITHQDNFFEIKHLLNNLFVYDNNVKSQDDIHIFFVSHTYLLQEQVVFTKYSKSCCIFCIWYTILRILNSNTNSQIICKNMELYLKNNPTNTIEKIILSFINLINITQTGIINSKKNINKQLLDLFL